MTKINGKLQLNSGWTSNDPKPSGTEGDVSHLPSKELQPNEGKGNMESVVEGSYKYQLYHMTRCKMRTNTYVQWLILYVNLAGPWGPDIWLGFILDISL